MLARADVFGAADVLGVAVALEVVDAGDGLATPRVGVWVLVGVVRELLLIRA